MPWGVHGEGPGTGIRQPLLWISTAAALFLPITDNEACELPPSHSTVTHASFVSPRGYLRGFYRIDGIAPVGSFFAIIVVSSAAIATVISRRWRAEQRHRMHVWVYRYLKVLAVQATVSALFPWLYAVCSTTFHIKYILLLIALRLCSCAQIVVLSHVSLRRLRIIGYHKAASRGLMLLTLCIAWSAGALGSYVIAQFVSGQSQDRWRQVFVGCIATAIIAYIAFQCNALVALGVAVCRARGEALRGEGSAIAVKGAALIALFTFFSATTGVQWLIAVLLDVFFYSRWSHFNYEFASTMNLVADTLLALSCAGFVGPLNHVQSLENVHDLLEQGRRRQILNTMQQAAQAVSGPATALAALFEGIDEEALLLQAASTFRSISWDVLKEHPHLVIDGHSLDGGVVDSELCNLSKPCRLAHCDAFWSHSWHDSGELKWAALWDWCEQFRRKHGRAPSLWFDKVCIDQANLLNELQRLPIYCSGCNTLLITCGHTYTTRLWCCTELFVYMSMLMYCEDASTSARPVLRVLGATDSEKAKVVEDWLHFDITRCDCYNADDKSRILAVVDQHPGGARGFNELIREYSHSVLQVGSERRLNFVLAEGARQQVSDVWRSSLTASCAPYDHSLLDEQEVITMCHTVTSTTSSGIHRHAMARVRKTASAQQSNSGGSNGIPWTTRTKREANGNIDHHSEASNAAPVSKVCCDADCDDPIWASETSRKSDVSFARAVICV